MKKIIIVSIMFCLMGYTYADITNQLGSEAFDYKYEGDSTALSGYTAANGATITTDGDIATFDSVPYKYYIGNDWVTATSNTNGWTYEIRFKVGTDHPGEYHINLEMASVQNNPDDKKQLIMFKDSGIDIYGVGTLISEDLTSDFHTLRIAQDANSSSYSFWVDGNFITSHNGVLGETETKYWFGALSGSNIGLFYIDYIRFTGEGAYAPGAALTGAKNPAPADATASVDVNTILSWTNGSGAYSHDIYFGTDQAEVANATTSSSVYVGNQIASEAGSNTFDPDLSYGATYYWRVDALDELGAVTFPGEVWSFTTFKTNFEVAGDLDGNMFVDMTDLNLFAQQWLNPVGCPTPDCADFDGVNGVDITDLGILASNWRVDAPPVITLIGSASVNVIINQPYNDKGATASDAIDGDLTANIVTTSTVDTSVLGTYYVTYNVNDSAGNTAETVTRTVNVVNDTISPVIILNGSNPVTVELGSAYNDAGATATDNIDGDISANIVVDTSNVDTSTVGSYNVTYNVSDSAGNAATEIVRVVNVTSLSSVNVSDNFDTAADSYDPYSESSPLNKYSTGLTTSEITFNHFGASTDTPDGSGKSFYIEAVVNVAADKKWYYYMDLPLPAEPVNFGGTLSLNMDMKMDAETIACTRVSVDDWATALKTEVGDGIILHSSDADKWVNFNIDDMGLAFGLDSANHFVNAYDVKRSDIGVRLRHLIFKIGATGPKTIKIYLDNYSLTGTQMDPTDWDDTYVGNYTYPAWTAYRARVRAVLDQQEARLNNLTELPTLPASPTDKQDYRDKKLAYYKDQVTSKIAEMRTANNTASGSHSYFSPEIMARTQECLDRYEATINPLIASINSPASDFDLYKVDAMKFGYLDGYTFPMDYPALTSYNLRMSRGEYSSIAMLLDPAPGYSETLVFENSDFSDGTNSFSADNLDAYIAKIWYQAGRDNTVRENYTTGGEEFLTQELLLKNENLVRVTHHTDERNVLPDGDNELWVTDTNGNNGRYINISTFYRSITDPTFPDPTTISFNDATSLQPFELDTTYKEIWAIVHIPDNAPAGTYTSTLTIKTQGGTVLRTIPLNVEVLPFDLAPSRLSYGLYYHGRLRADKPETDIIPLSCHEKTTPQQTIELQDMFDHGVMYPAGYENDVRVFDNTLAIRNSIGFPKDKYFFFGKSLHLDSVSGDFTPFQSILGDYGYDTNEMYIYGREEAGSEELESLIDVTVNEIYSVGIKVATAVYKNAFASVGNYLDVAIYADGIHAAGIEQQVADWHSAGQEIYSYGDPQVGVENPEVYRRNYGIAAYQKGFDGVMDYAYQKEYGITWNDFDAKPSEINHREENFTYQTTNGIVGTVEWEGFRAAVTDMRYLSTLLEIRDQKEANGEDVSAIDAWIANLNTDANLDDVRSQIIDKIIELQ